VSCLLVLGSCLVGFEEDRWVMITASDWLRDGIRGGRKLVDRRMTMMFT
jgi:hypothetical protein